MKLSELAGETVTADPVIAGLTADSRAVSSGYLFAALPGVNADGEVFIPQAEKNGAAAILSRPGAKTSLPLIADANPRRRFAQMAARYFPRQPDFIAGITGTNGKTSTAHFAEQIWSRLGRKAGSIGTLGARGQGIEIKTGLTTPEPVTLHRALDALAGAGVDHLAMEVSSHAIEQARADGVKFRAAAFTNITQDHLDYHPTFEDYFAAKERLFSELLPADGTVVVNADGEGAARIIAGAKARGQSVLTAGKEGNDIKLTSSSATPDGIFVKVNVFGERVECTLPLVGAFQAENVLLAAGLVVASGEAPHRVFSNIEKLSGVPGRMERVAHSNKAGIYVDYAHTPDAIATALQALRPHARGRVLVVIGAGGDRDRAKRPLMGRAAAEYADRVIVTDDNPRTEDPAAIRKQVLKGCAEAVEIGDRGEAIAYAVSELTEGDVLLIAGKGHEKGQQVGDQLLPFDDAAVARICAASGEGSG